MDFDIEVEKFNFYWNEEGRKAPENPKRALLNWLTKARDIKGDNGNGYRHGRPPRALPTKYTRPEDLDREDWGQVFHDSIGAPLD